MATMTESPSVEGKARELCEFIIAQDGYQDSLKRIMTFLKDEGAKELYGNWQEKRAEMNQWTQQGMKPKKAEVEELERLKGAVMDNEVVMDYVDAEKEMNEIFGTVTKLLQKSLQHGRVPTADEMAESDCCGKSGCCQ